MPNLTSSKKMVLTVGFAICGLLVAIYGMGFRAENGSRTFNATRHPIDPGDRMPPFILLRLNGEPITNRSVQGHKAVLLVVQSTCPHCRREISALSRFASDFANQARLLFVSLSTETETAEFSAATKSGAFMYTDGSRLAQMIGVREVPFMLLLDEDGTVRCVQQGERPESGLKELLSEFVSDHNIPQAQDIRCKVR
jgi:peroxiredoxin